MELKAGNITLQYDNGSLRYLRTASCEVLRMIYFTVRDQNWITVPSTIANEKINLFADSFDITYECLFENEEIKMQWSVRIEGTKQSKLRFMIQGTALTNFEKNRAGFCVLHPIKECAGNSVAIEHPDGKVSESKFPVDVSPHQPFKNIAGMKWTPSPTCHAKVRFSGDVFETEDHRNWSDNNYKTYCTPLSIPFPASMNVGDVISQIVELTVDEQIEAPTTIVKQVDITINRQERFAIPHVGVGLGMEGVGKHRELLGAMSGLRFHHCRVDIRLNDANWPARLTEAINDCHALHTKLELCVFVDEGTISALRALQAYTTHQSAIWAIAILPLHAKCVDDETLARVAPFLRETFPNTLIGGGTDRYFTELNRSSLRGEELDFVQYSVNPQVHAFDDDSIVENAGAQTSVIPYARKKFEKRVHISPVTLKMRYNADAADVSKIQFIAPDPRHKTRFGAAWTLASLKHAIESGVNSLTYYEMIGNGGMLEIINDKPEWFPVASVLNYILDERWTAIYKSVSSRPFRVSSLVLTSGNELCLLIANHTKDKVSVLVEWEKSIGEIQSIYDETTKTSLKQLGSTIRFELSPEDIVSIR